MILWNREVTMTCLLIILRGDLLALFQVATRGNGVTIGSATMFIASLVTSLFSYFLILWEFSSCLWLYKLLDAYFKFLCQLSLLLILHNTNCCRLVFQCFVIGGIGEGHRHGEDSKFFYIYISILKIFKYIHTKMHILVWPLNWPKRCLVKYILGIS